MPSARGEEKRAALIGAGRMGGAMALGWIRDLKAAGLSQLDLIEPSPTEEIRRLAKGAVRLNSSPAPVDILVLAVKPQAFRIITPAATAWVGPETLIISIMAGVTLTRIAAALNSAKVVRAMPNTPGAIGMGVTGFCLSSACGDLEGETASRLLAPLGLVVGPLAEHEMDAVTAVSGSGPAYVFLLAEALAAAGRAAGLSEATAALLARQTVIGAGALLAQSSEDPAALRKAVTSPGGTTAAALDVLMAQGGLPELLRRAVAAAATRGSDLAKET